MITLFSPVYLWGLVGLLVPVLIHLWSNKEGKVIQVGSLKFFPTKQTHRNKSVRINEIWLLLLRTLLVALLAILLADPIFQSPPGSLKKMLFVERSVLQRPGAARFFDSLAGTIEQAPRFFEPGFPYVDGPVTGEVQKQPAHYWQLLQQASRSLPIDSLIVLSSTGLAGFKGKRPGLPVSVEWYTVPKENSFSFIADAYRKDNGLTVFTVTTSAEKTSVDYQRFDENDLDQLDTRREGSKQYVKLKGQDFWVPVKAPLPLEVRVGYDEDFLYDSYYITAALNSIAGYFSADFNVTADPVSKLALENSTGITVWLSEEPLDMKMGKCLYYSPDPASENLIEPAKKGVAYRLTQRLTAANVFEKDLVGAFMPLVIDTDRLDSLLAIYDQRVLPSSQAEPVYVPGQRKSRPKEARAPYELWALCAILFLAERGLSFFREQ